MPLVGWLATRDRVPLVLTTHGEIVAEYFRRAGGFDEPVIVRDLPETAARETLDPGVVLEVVTVAAPVGVMAACAALSTLRANTASHRSEIPSIAAGRRGNSGISPVIWPLIIWSFPGSIRLTNHSHNFDLRLPAFSDHVK